MISGLLAMLTISAYGQGLLFPLLSSYVPGAAGARQVSPVGDACEVNKIIKLKKMIWS